MVCSAASGSTPFGLYDTDSEFQTEAPQVVTCGKKRLGYPIMDVELQDNNLLVLKKLYLNMSTSKSIQYS